ncbi:hypothetical protein CIHG_07904 [Coccidioides immitis H538.4]|uniref:Uncharacterized protein n=2 Tax=Coccidioides immitis TaxID=5501 RepID=A0A0J8S163_COCIT|nr:hypothetical protein CIRG_10117 [Coccidioides immitis RMSCC 2394]KMU90094.1 hypothetical protein CIHG_07904 [Coccidioides immitis H538.4]
MPAALAIPAPQLIDSLIVLPCGLAKSSLGATAVQRVPASVLD